MKAGELMTAKVITVHEDATIADAIRLMLEHRIQRPAGRRFRR